MKKRINLFDQKKDKVSAEDIYFKIRNLSFVILLLVIIIGLALFLYSNYLDDRQKSLKLSETIATHKIQINNGNAQKLTDLISHKELLEKHLKDDAQFLPYYRLLTSVLLSAEGEPILTFLKIDKLRATNFTLRFQNYDEMRKFLVTAESEAFTQHFDTIHMGSFTLSDEAEGYELDFTGTFSTIQNLNE